MKYVDAIAITSGIMVSTGISSFCRNACKGTCCRGQLGKCSEPYNCDEKLVCTSFLCSSLRSAIRKIAPDAETALSVWSEAVRGNLLRILGFNADTQQCGPFFSTYEKNQVMCIEVGDPPIVTVRDARAIRNMLEVVRARVQQATIEFDKISGYADCSGFGLLEYTFQEYFGETAAT